MRPTLVLFVLHFLLFAPPDVTFSQQSIRNTSRVSSQEQQKHTTHAKYKEGMQQKEMQQKEMQQEKMEKTLQTESGLCLACARTNTWLF